MGIQSTALLCCCSAYRVAGLAAWRIVTLVTESPTFQVAHIALHGTDRLSRGEVMALTARFPIYDGLGA